MDLLDLIIILLVVAAAASGWRRGLSWVGLSLLGLLLGCVIGSALASPLARHFGGHDASTIALVGTFIFLALVALIQGIGTAIGYQLRIATQRTRFGELDSMLGTGIAVIGTLAVSWYLGLSFAGSPYTRLDAQIRDSAILRGLVAVFPSPPGFLGQLGTILHDPNLGNPFSGLGGTNLQPLPIPADANTPGIRHVAASTVKVISEGCGTEAGSAWPMGDDLFVTNAHVVAGGQQVGISLPPGDGRQLRATVVFFDPDEDVAVLRAPGSGLAALTIGANPARGVTGAVVGYPRGGPESVVPAAVRGSERAEGKNIYGTALVTRTIVVLQADVIPGNSGGPVVDRSGTVVGLVFAASTIDQTEGYALSPSEISADLQRARGATQPVSTQDCTS